MTDETLRAALDRAIESCYAGQMPPSVMRSPEAVVVHMRQVLEGIAALEAPAPALDVGNLSEPAEGSR